MVKRVAASVAFAVLAGACASSGPGTQDTATGPSLEQAANQQVVSGFRAAVVDVCVASAINGTAVADLASETGPIVREEDPAIAGLANPQAGDTVWSSRAAKGAVLIRTNARECQVSVSGQPMRQTFEAVGQGLSDPHGFVLEPTAKNVASSAPRRYMRKVGERTFHVTLSGLEPGRLLATVTATPPA